MTNIIRVAIYARVSTGMQAEEGKSLDAQIAEMQEFAEKRGWKVVAKFVDAGESGTDMDRRGLQEALEAAEEGAFDILLVHELSRLSRSMFDTLSIFEQLGEYKVGFASVNDPNFDFSQPASRLMLTMLAALNQYYVDMLKLHTAKSKRERARQGLYNASITPFGYQHVGDADTPPEIVPEEAEIVREMFKKYATGKWSYNDLAEWSWDAKYKTRKGNNFSKDAIAEIIRNRFYRGQVVYRQGKHGQDAGEVFEGQHEAIVSDDLWEMCRKMRERRSASPRTYQPKYRVYLLNGIIYCDICGRKLRAQGASAGDYYREMSRSRGFIDCPDSGRGVRTEVIDDQVGAIFRRVRLPEDWQEELAEMVDEDPDLETLKNRRARLVAQRRRLKNALADGVFNKDKDIYDTRMDRIERQLSKLPAEANLEAMGHAADVIEEIAEIWDDATKEERRDLLRLAVEAVKADVPQGRLVTIEPYPVFVPLLRKVPFLRETAFGVFRPIWPQDIVEELEVMDTLDPLGKVPRKETPDWPLVMTLPKDIAGARITPLLSDWLKDRRKADEPLGPVVALENPDAPPLRVDTRYWDTTIERVEDLSEVESNSAAFLWSSFALQRREDKRGLIIEAQRVVEEDGLWVWVDVLPSSMAGHWLYQYFPGAWENDQGLTWNAFDLYNTLVKAGFETEMKRQSIYQPVTLGAARAMVQKRDRCPQLAILPDVVYEEGMERLEAAIEEKGEAHQVSSEICLVVVQATG
jgi:site-specific DNA recombinase